MATLTTGAVLGFNMEALQLFKLFEKTNEITIATQYRTFFNANNATLFFGAGLTYGGAFPNTTLTGGTFNQIVDVAAGANVFNLFGFSILATDLFAFYQSADTQGAFGAMLSGNDTITGNIGTDVLLGYNGNDRLGGGLGADTMFGGIGNDTYVVDNVGDIVDETAGGGTDTVESSVDFALGAGIENLTLIGAAIAGDGNELANTVTGNSQANFLTGNDGDDILDGKAGNDFLFGDSGNDSLAGGLGNDTMDAGDGNDSLFGADGNDLMAGGNGNDAILGEGGNDTGDGGAGIDALVGGAGNDALFGGSDPDVLLGDEGDDVLDGGTGNDSMQGGIGNDVFIVDNPLDLVSDTSGVDRVESRVSYTLSVDIENLRLLGSAQIGNGNASANTIEGNAADNTLNGLGGIDIIFGGGAQDIIFGAGGGDTLHGEDGNDVLFGGAENDILWGGAGNDRLNGELGDDVARGGAGDDLYQVDSLSDSIIEQLNEGTDTVVSTINLTLAINLENLTLAGTALTATGNALANRLVGNGLANTLNGLAGADVMQGNLGADSYFVDDLGDLVFELNAPGEIDTVTSFVDFRLGAFIENLTLQGPAKQATGNDLANVLNGNAQNNVIDGKKGADTMTGFGGNDTYYIDDFGDTVVEGVGAGLDTVFSSVTYTLQANVDNLTIIGTNTTGGFGNALNNTIIGNALANSIEGKDGDDILEGGLGTDTFIGGIGLDDFRYTHLAADNDSIFDFAAGQDDIAFSVAAFEDTAAGVMFAPGALAANRLVSGATPTAGLGAGIGQFLYDTDDGRLIWDQNGTAAGGQFLIATLTTKPPITAADFLVIP